MNLFDHVFKPWTCDGDRHIVAPESHWREPAEWDKATCGARPRVLVNADPFEPWELPPGKIDVWDTKYRMPQMQTSDFRWATINRHMGRFTGYHSCNLKGGNDALTLPHVIKRTFDTIDACPHLDWLIHTEYPERIAEMMPESGEGYESGGSQGWIPEPYRPNLWLGTTIRTQADADARIPHLLRVPAAKRVLWCEPSEGIRLQRYRIVCDPIFGDFDEMWDWLEGRVWLDGQVGAPTAHVNFVICAGATDHARSILAQCRAAGVPFWGMDFDVKELPR